MAGCKALTEEQIKLVTRHLDSNRDKALFILGLKTGFRISELLSLKIGDVYQDGAILPRIKVIRSNMKGKQQSRTVVLHQDAIKALTMLLDSIMRLDPGQPLFRSQKGQGRAISRSQAHRTLANAHKAAGVLFNGTHCMRKTLALKVYLHVNKDLMLTQKALGHKSILSTVSYLPINENEVDEAMLK